MFALFRALSERVKALFVTTVAIDFEADMMTRDAERKAELFRLADRYEADGLADVAENLRRRAETLSLQRPLACVLPAAEHLIGKDGNQNPLMVQATHSARTLPILPLRLPAAKTSKKKER